MSVVQVLPAIGGRSRLQWATVDVGFQVASRDGDFIGSVVETDAGAFIAHDGTSTPIGRFDSGAAARAAVEAWEPPSRGRRRAERERAFLPAATVAAVVATGTALMAGTIAPYL